METVKMRHILVCEGNEELIRKFKFEALVTSTTDPDAVSHFKRVIEEDNKVHCISLHTDLNFADLDPRDDWKDIPMHIYAPQMGDFMDFVRIRELLLPLHVRVFLSASRTETYTDLQLMASLGINCGITFDETPIDWNEFNDLMSFAIYPKVPRATIEPFHNIVISYQPKEAINFRGVYFNNPMRYLHVDKDENFALTAEDLKNGNYLFTGIAHLADIENNPKYIKQMNAWKKSFHKITTCSSCPAWRICGGFFSDRLETNPGCKEAFSELIDAADMHYENRGNVKVKEDLLCQL